MLPLLQQTRENVMIIIVPLHVRATQVAHYMSRDFLNKDVSRNITMVHYVDNKHFTVSYTLSTFHLFPHAYLYNRLIICLW